MSSGLKKTFEVLSTSRNEAATAVAIVAFESADLSVRDRAIQTLTSRRNKSGHLAVMRQWHVLTPDQQQIVLESRARVGGALRDAILADEPQLFANACEMVRITGDFDVIPTLVNIAEDADHPHARQATALVHELVARLGMVLQEPRNDGMRRNPEAIRNHLLDYLSRSVERFRYHKRVELIEAFIVLSGSSGERLIEILDDPHHACFNTVLHILSTSENSVIHDLLLGLLDTDEVPTTALNTISKRIDRPFIERLLHLAQDTSSPRVRNHLKRVRAFAWLKMPGMNVVELPESQQVQLVELLLLANVKREEMLHVLEELLLRGSPSGRLAACNALATISGDRINKLILEAVNDEDSRVQAAATRQLRDRHIPGTMPTLLRLLDSQHKIVRKAARDALSEFSFENYLLGYESMNLESRQNSGGLVLKVDEKFYEKLTQELIAPTPRRRLRALEIVENLHVVGEVVDVVTELLGDDDHLVRTAAATALQHCAKPQVRAALEGMLEDRSPAIRSAARSALDTLAGPQLDVSSGKPILTEGD